MWQKCVEKKYRKRKFVDVQTYLISMFIKTIFTTLLSFIKFIPILSLIIDQIIIQKTIQLNIYGGYSCCHIERHTAMQNKSMGNS